ncbi:MAG: hypothetical protein OEZ43_16935 [Gammaproteobacteria bacterium]|nr:hypothetical protein [Gammaproteobacteria bacterium]
MQNIRLYIKPNLINLPILYLLSFVFTDHALAASSPLCPDEKGYIFTNYQDENPREGGFVSNSADVDVSARIAATAAVCGSASVLDDARIYGNAVISGEAIISDNARVYGNARVQDNAHIKDDANISGNAVIGGDAIVGGKLHIRGEDHIESGIHGINITPSTATIATEEKKAETTLPAFSRDECVAGLQQQCLAWEKCDTLVKGECAKAVVQRFNSTLEKCHEFGYAKDIPKTETGFYKRSIVIDGERVICNSEEKLKRIAAADKARQQRQQQLDLSWCKKNPITSIEQRASSCQNRCEQMTGHRKTPREYYEKCSAICGKNKDIRLARHQHRCPSSPQLKSDRTL